MNKAQKINIYVGTVGSAYIDKETALKNVKAAQQNVTDVEKIIIKAEHVKGDLQTSITRADYARDAASLVKNRLTSLINDYQSRNAIIYAQLVALKNELETNDNDGVYKNGGNVNTANENIENAEGQLTEIDKVIAAANILLEDNKKLLAIRENEYNNAVNEFSQYVPNAEFSIDDLSNDSEDYLNNRIDEIDSNIDIIDDVTNHINNYSDEVNSTIEDILNGANTDNPVDESGNKLYWYAGQMIPAQYYLSSNEDFIVTEDTVNTWHELTLVKGTRNGEEINKLLATIGSLSMSTTWYILVPELLGLNAVKSDMVTIDSRFKSINNLTTVNGVAYQLYEVDNSIPVADNIDGSRLNIIMITGAVETPEEPEQPDITANYWYIGTTSPNAFDNPSSNLVTDNSSLGWRTIEGDLNDYVENNPYWSTAIVLDPINYDDVDYYLAVPEHSRFKDAVNNVDLSTYDSINIGGKTYNVYKMYGLEFNLEIYIDPSYTPSQGEPEPTGQTGEPEPSGETGQTGEPEPSGDYYWYIGLTDPSNDVILENLAQDVNSLGWHWIGSELGQYSSSNNLNKNTESIVLNEDYDDVDFYLALPGQLKVYDALGPVALTNLGTVTKDNVEYTIYKGNGAEFNLYIY